MHACILLIAVAFFDWSKNVSLLGDTKHSFISSYVFHASLPTTSSIKTKNEIKNLPDKALRLIKSKRKHQLASSPSTVSAHQTGEQTKSLLALLHSAIQKEQHYPLNAIETERQGTSTVKFFLFPNGKITNLQIVKSSGVESLDLAALAAVQHAVPFQEVDTYLQSAQEFSIDVVFELA